MPYKHLLVISGTLFVIQTWIPIGNGGDPKWIATSEITQKEYYIDTVHSNSSVDFKDFMQYCHTHGLEGATIKTYDEQDAIEEFYTTKNYSSHFRLAGWNINLKGDWIWLDDYSRIEAEGRFVNWDDGQPSGRPENKENCLTLFRNWYKWHDHPCKYFPGYRALCQKQLQKRRNVKPDP